MTVPASNQPLAIDYTSRDYYSLREALIERVKLRVPTWQGTDVNDFGVALVESFAYMGDLVNYYIDRIANESYIYTATQRKNILNLATMFGYTPGGYVSANVDVTFTNNGGYKGQIGGSQMGGDGAPDGTASIIIPNVNPFIVGDLFTVTGMPRTEYNGTWIVNTNEIRSGSTKNTITYIPEYTIVAATYSSAEDTVTYEYTQAQGNQVLENQVVNISGMTPSGYDQIEATVTSIGINEESGNFTFTVDQATSVTAATDFGVVKYNDIILSEAVVGTISEVGYTIIPAGTQLSADIINDNVVEQVLFTTVTESVVPFGGSSVAIAEQGINVSTLSENLADSGTPGDINGELIGQSTGEADQSFFLKETVVDLASIKVFVQRGDVYEQWTKVTYIEDYSSTDAVFSVSIDADNRVSILFGDGISGTVPPTNSDIKATYILGGGNIGNIAAYAIDGVYDVPGATSAVRDNILQYISVTNLVEGNGGAEPESDANIRYNAPKALRALNRAVTLQDFSSLALAVPNVAKANSTALSPNSITISVAPTTTSATDNTPGFEGGVESASLVSLRGVVADFLSDKAQIGASITVSPPRYVPINLTIAYTKYDQYSEDSIKNSIKEAVFNAFSFENSEFGETISSRDVEYELRSIVGVKSLKVTKLYRAIAEPGLTTVSAAQDELLYFPFDGISWDDASSSSLLTGLALNDGSPIALTPAFNGSIFNYLATASTSLTLGVTPTSAGSTITVNGTIVSSGASTNVTLRAGTNPPIVVTVVAADGVTVSNYVLNVIKV